MDRKPVGSLQRGAAAGRIVDATPEPSPETADALRRLELVAHWLDGAFRLPGTSWRFGLDGILGLVPGAGDSLTAVAGAYIILEAWRLGVPSSVIVRMLGNIGLDWAVGSVPLVGDIFDFAFKSHRRNVDLLRRHLSERPR